MDNTAAFLSVVRRPHIDSEIHFDAFKIIGKERHEDIYVSLQEHTYKYIYIRYYIQDYFQHYGNCI